MNVIDHVYDAYSMFFNIELDEVEQIGRNIPMPKFPAEVVSALFNDMQELVKVNHSVIRVPLPCFVIGDIHGNFHDLVRIFLSIKNPPDKTFLFLGDYVDRGQFSLDVVMLLFVLKLKFPKNISFLRGNHEFKHINESYGFKDEIKERYGNIDLWLQIQEIFDYLPFAAIIGNEILCLHGGIGPSFDSISTIDSIRLPVRNCDTQLIQDIVWSDPSMDVSFYLSSIRGVGSNFGVCAIQAFFKQNNLKKLIRAHQCVQHGIQTTLNNQCITVFSSSNYAGKENKASFIEVDSVHCIKAATLEPIKPLLRSEANFLNFGLPHQYKRRGSICLTIPALVNNSSNPNFTSQSKGIPISTIVKQARTTGIPRRPPSRTCLQKCGNTNSMMSFKTSKSSNYSPPPLSNLLETSQ